jgi:hypothetical protein
MARRPDSDDTLPVTFNVESDEGTITLTGSVDRQHDRDAAAFIAKVVPGVVGVENQLEVRDRSPDGQAGEDVEDLTRAEVSQIGELDAEAWPPAKTRHVGSSGIDSQRPRAGSRSFGQPRRPEETPCSFRMERYLEALESDAIDVHSRLASMSDARSYDGKVVQREIIAMESGVAVAEAKLDEARAAERDDHRGEADAQVRAVKAEVRGIRALFDRTFGTKRRADDSDVP